MKILLVFIPSIAKELSGKSVLVTLKITVQLWYFVLSRKVFKQTGDFKVVGSYNKQAIIFYLRYVMDIAVLREVFVDKEYDWCPIQDPKVIIDLGAHFGDTTLYYASRFPAAKIIAVEPSPENYERLVKHTCYNPNIIPVQAAVGGEDGEIKLHLMPSSLGHSVVERLGNASAVSVSQLSLASLFQKFNITKADLVKFDIEGAEFDLFRKLSNDILINVLIGELHFDLDETATEAELLKKLADYSVKFEKIDNQPMRKIVKAVRSK